jgi:hypothetical protein
MGGGSTDERNVIRPTQARITRRLWRGFGARGLGISNASSSKPEPDGVTLLSGENAGWTETFRQEQLI